MIGLWSLLHIQSTCIWYTLKCCTTWHCRRLSNEHLTTICNNSSCYENGACILSPFTIGHSANVNAGLNVSWITLFTQIEIGVYGSSAIQTTANESIMNCDKRPYTRHLLWCMICSSWQWPSESLHLIALVKSAFTERSSVDDIC
jgi:hypothetical protein